MAKTIRFQTTGGPEVLDLVESELPALQAGQVLVRHAHIGVNFIDIYHRMGVYPLPLPSGLGVEAAGTIEDVGPGVTMFKVGQKVAYPMSAPGAYADLRICDAAMLIGLPEGIGTKLAAGVLLKGLTAQYLIRQIHPVRPGETLLFHAAAGGTGLLACQWAKALGARVIGTVGSEAKAALARAHGCDEVIVTAREDFVSQVRDLTQGRGVPVVYDGVGKDTFTGSLDCLSPRGLMVSFGQSSGKVPPFDITILSGKGSLRLTRPTITTFIAKPEERQAMADDLFSAIGTGKIQPKDPTEYPLAEAAAAHRDLGNRATTGAIVLLPGS